MGLLFICKLTTKHVLHCGKKRKINTIVMQYRVQYTNVLI